MVTGNQLLPSPHEITTPLVPFYYIGAPAHEVRSVSEGVGIDASCKFGLVLRVGYSFSPTGPSMATTALAW